MRIAASLGEIDVAPPPRVSTSRMPIGGLNDNVALEVTFGASLSSN